MSKYVRAYEGDQPYIFVSYAHKDSEIVLPVIRQLFELKYRVWYDEGIRPGSEWPLNVEQHLQRAAAVLVFVSKHSILSINCKNEIAKAPGNAKMILISIGGEEHGLDNGLLNHSAERETYCLDAMLLDNLTRSLSGELIGDGITGYEYSIDKKRSFNTWNLLLGLAAALAICFSVLLYGLYTGFFDSLLPAKQATAITDEPIVETEESISIEDNLLGSVLPVAFSSETEKNAVYNIIGWGEPYEMTYKDLMGIDWITDLQIWNEPIDSIAFAAYLPNLESITIANIQITDLSPLAACPKLETVYLTVNMLPVTIPSPRNFEVEIL